jgi:septum formation protein
MAKPLQLQSRAPIILASTSTIRKTLCDAVGLPVQCMAPTVDEDVLKLELTELTPPELARALAEAKALSISTTHPDAYVIGADQICALGTRIFGKSGNAATALEHLLALQGNMHEQHSGYAIAHQGRITHSGTTTARLHMHGWSREELERYIAAEQPFGSAGSYKFESIGRLLFAQMEGSSDMVLGLPLSPILSYFRTQNIVSF